MRLVHAKQFSFRLFIKQRYIYSKYFAGMRYAPEQLGKRFFAFFATIILPFILCYRIYSQIRLKKRLKREFYTALPLLIVFSVIWAIGEMDGYLMGAGDVLTKIE